MIFELNHSSSTPLFRQLYGELRKAILHNRLPPGSKLPSTRQLADDLRVSRNTVLNAYEQLIAEGYIYGQPGSGIYVATSLQVPPKAEVPRRKHELSKRGKVVADTKVSNPSLANAKISFRPGTPALEKFPFTVWGKLLTKSLQQLRARDFHYSDPAGYPPLREAIAQYLNRNRGLKCEASQVLIVNGSQQALDLCCKVLLDPGETVWMEDPGYKGARAAFVASGARVVPVPIDREGLKWDTVRESVHPRFIYTTPSHQFPMGVTMSLQRRLSLLQFANNANAWILEDDYDSEFRYDGRPLAALQGLDQYSRVVYIGTFSKVMFAGLRLGYMVAPSDLIRAFLSAKAITDRHSAILEQAALAEFLISGRFERHIRNMRKVYEARQKKLVEGVHKYLYEFLTVEPAPAGMHLIGWLRRGVRDTMVSERMAEQGVEIPALSSYASHPPPRGGFIFGYSALPPQRITQGLMALANVLRQL